LVAYNAALGGTLALDWSGMSGSTDFSRLWILKNDTSGTLSGTFANYANGDSLGIHDGREWFIWYRADALSGNLVGGNDVVIAAVPEPSAFLLIGLSACAIAAWKWKRRK
jgi:hypothetical protein